jgi:DnaD/phage-associated family protein
MLLCSHAASMDKRSVRYIERLALHYYDLDVRSVAGLEEELNSIEDRASLEAYVRNIFGLGKRALIKKEKEYISAWSDKYKFSKDIIQRAYEVTVAKTNEPKLSYANAVLENWYSAGYKTIEDIDKAEAEWKDNKKTGSGSFITDDFYEDALMRSYGSDNNKTGE